VTNHYVWGLDLSGSLQGAGGIGGLLSATFGGTNSVSSVFYTYDGNGNVSELVNTNGAVVAHYEYDAFGNTTAATGAMAEANPFRFSTKYLDTETGLYYYGLRYYHPELGRWVNRDPIEEEGAYRLGSKVQEARRQGKRQRGVYSACWPEVLPPSDDEDPLCASLFDSQEQEIVLVLMPYAAFSNNGVNNFRLPGLADINEFPVAEKIHESGIERTRNCRKEGFSKCMRQGCHVLAVSSLHVWCLQREGWIVLVKEGGRTWARTGEAKLQCAS